MEKDFEKQKMYVASCAKVAADYAAGASEAKILSDEETQKRLARKVYGVRVNYNYFKGTFGARSPEWATHENSSEILKFETINAAQDFANNMYPGTYYLKHGETDRPTTTVRALPANCLVQYFCAPEQTLNVMAVKGVITHVYSPLNTCYKYQKLKLLVSYLRTGDNLGVAPNAYLGNIQSADLYDFLQNAKVIIKGLAATHNLQIAADIFTNPVVI